VKLHIVSGFLGSGKTTAIIGAAKILVGEGLKVGIVTNDQGRYLVDTAFFQRAAFPTVEVTGGCFCCNYQDLESQLQQLQERAQPDVIFAESVGSCADVVATVVKPLSRLRRLDSVTSTTFSVFVDARLLRRRLLDLPMPFSEDVVYLFDKQIEEAGLLVINKRDLLQGDEAEGVAALARDRYPAKAIRLQNSLESGEVLGWLRALQRGAGTPPEDVLEIDYARYGAGESELAWLDEQVTFGVPGGLGSEVVRDFILELLRRLEERGAAIGHLKFLLESKGRAVKLSVPTLRDSNWISRIPSLPGSEVSLLINARVQIEAEVLRALVADALAAVSARYGLHPVVSEVVAFHPSQPHPTYRLP